MLILHKKMTIMVSLLADSNILTCIYNVFDHEMALCPLNYYRN